jgi:hypothetical protein
MWRLLNEISSQRFATSKFQRPNLDGVKMENIRIHGLPKIWVSATHTRLWSKRYLCLLSIVRKYLSSILYLLFSCTLVTLVLCFEWYKHGFTWGDVVYQRRAHDSFVSQSAVLLFVNMTVATHRGLYTTVVWLLITIIDSAGTYRCQVRATQNTIGSISDTSYVTVNWRITTKPQKVRLTQQRNADIWKQPHRSSCSISV